MIIDFHTHIFPDKIAEKTIALLSKKGGLPPFSNGTADGLTDRMARAGVDVALTLPVLTSPAQFESVNRFAMEINLLYANQAQQLISFAGIHPDCDEIEEKMKWIKENGFLGVKIHPDYQQTLIDDEKYVRILACAKEYDLIVVTHAGADAAYPDTVHCPPARALNLIRKVPHSKLVLAHLGGNEMPEEVLDTLCGENVYFDTAYVLRFTPAPVFRRILERHGADKILFASDSPWSDIAGDADLIRSFDLDQKTEEKILCENAKALLGI